MASARYILGDPLNFTLVFRAKYIDNLTLVRCHGVSAALTLALGPFQWLRDRGHRLRGYLYLASVLVGSVTGLWLALLAFGGWSSKLGFSLMAVLWAYTGFRAYGAARLKHFEQHRQWMVRNFALAFGAVALRLYLEIAQGCGLDFFAIYPNAVWVAWLPCLVSAELYLWSGERSQTRKGRLPAANEGSSKETSSSR